MEWSGQSLDLDTTEDWWGDIKNAVFEVKLRNEDELCDVIEFTYFDITLYQQERFPEINLNFPLCAVL